MHFPGKKIPEIVSRHKANLLRLLPSGPDLVRNASFHEVPGICKYNLSSPLDQGIIGLILVIMLIHSHKLSVKLRTGGIYVCGKIVFHIP